MVVWAQALAVPLVLGPFSAAGKVPRGSPSALVSLCWEIPTCWLIPSGWRGKPDVPYPVFAMHFLGPLMATSSFVCNENGGRVGSFHSVLSRRLRYDCPWRVVALSVCSYPDSEDWSLYPACQGPSPWRLSLACPVQATPQGVGDSRATVLAAPCVLEPFSIAGKVPKGSLSDLFALCYEIQWSWLTPRV